MSQGPADGRYLPKPILRLYGDLESSDRSMYPGQAQKRLEDQQEMLREYQATASRLYEVGIAGQ